MLSMCNQPQGFDSRDIFSLSQYLNVYHNLVNRARETAIVTSIGGVIIASLAGIFGEVQSWRQAIRETHTRKVTAAQTLITEVHNSIYLTGNIRAYAWMAEHKEEALQKGFLAPGEHPADEMTVCLNKYLDAPKTDALVGSVKLVFTSQDVFTECDKLLALVHKLERTTLEAPDKVGKEMSAAQTELVPLTDAMRKELGAN